MSGSLSDADQVADKVLEMLQHARKVPGMNFWPVNFQAASNFFGGVGIGAMAAIGAMSPTSRLTSGMNDCRRDAERSRGYGRATNALSEFERQVRNRCANEEQVVDELFEIEIDAWNRLRESLKSQVSLKEA